MSAPDPQVLLPAPRRWPVAVLGIVLGIAGTIAVATILDRQSTADDAETQTEVALATAAVTQTDLIEEVEWVADLTYGEPVDVAAPADGTVTAAVDVGTSLRRGDVVVEIDQSPVIALYGDIPAWRDLREGDEGPDVRQLEVNLVALGFDPDGTITIDDEFSALTEEMVERWQEAAGLEVTGEVTADSIVVVQGPVVVTTTPRVGDPARVGATLASISARAATDTVVSAAGGDVTDVATIGSTVEHGTVLFRLDGVDVVALHGFDPIPGRDGSTTWHAVFVEPGRQVSGVLAPDGTTLNDTAPVLELSTQTLAVVIPVGLSDQDDWTIGQLVDIVLPDASMVDGHVVEVGTVAQTAGQGEEPTIDVTVEITELVDDELPASEVTVVVAGEQVLDAMVVPTRALVTLAEGGFAVEKVLGDGATMLVAVETGAFDNGIVEVTSSQLIIGDALVVPA